MSKTIITKKGLDIKLIGEAKGLPGASAHASLPCTCWSTWQAMSEHKFGQEYTDKLKVRRDESRQMLESFIRFAEAILAGGGEVSFGWPKTCLGWHLPELMEMITRFDMHSVIVHSCPLGMTNTEGEPALKQWRFVTTLARMAAVLEPLKCAHEELEDVGACAGLHCAGREGAAVERECDGGPVQLDHWIRLGRV